MSGRIILDSKSPKSLSIDFVKALLIDMGRKTDPMPSVLPLSDGTQLVMSGKGDAYYTTTSAIAPALPDAFTPASPANT